MDNHVLRLIVGTVAALACFVMAGCRESSIEPPGVSGYSLRFDSGGQKIRMHVNCGSLVYTVNGKKVQGMSPVLWSDLDNGSGSGSGTRVSGQHMGFGKKVTWKWESADGKSGSVTIAGTYYDLAKGSLFLIGARHGEIKVQQLKRDTISMKPEERTFYNLAQNDKKVAAFIARASKAKKAK